MGGQMLPQSWQFKVVLQFAVVFQMWDLVLIKNVSSFWYPSFAFDECLKGLVVLFGICKDMWGL